MALEDLLNPQFGEPIETGHELRYMCPLCGSSKQKLFVNNDPLSTKYGQWICFNCGEAGNLISLLMKGLHIAFAKATELVQDSGVTLAKHAYDELLSNNENLMIAIKSRGLITAEQEPLDRVEIPVKPAPPLPYGLIYFRDARPEDAEPFYQYLEHRGFSRQLVTKLGYGFIKDGYALSGTGSIIPLHNHVVFITYNQQGQYLYWNTRAIYDAKPKSVNAPNTKTNDYLGKGDVVYNLETALQQPTVILTEGVPDALTLYPYGVATFGKQITEFQKGLLVQTLRPEQNLVVMLDMDASYLLTQTAKDIYKYHKKTFMVFNPTRMDANSLGRDKAFEVIKNNLIVPDTNGLLTFKLRMKV